MIDLTAKKIFLTKGVGRDREKLTSLERALRNAGIAPFNLVPITSIFPPGAKLISRDYGMKLLDPGQILFCVMSKNSTNEPHRLITTSIGVALPKSPHSHGYLSEFSGFGLTDEKAGDYAEDLAAQMLATTLGVKFDPDSSYDEKKQIWRLSDQIVKTTNITQSAIGDKNGRWTTVVSAAVLIL
jgi:arginine decarboxylase